MEIDSHILAFRINDACKALSISRSSIYTLIARGDLKSISIAGRTLIPRCEIERILNEALTNA